MLDSTITWGDLFKVVLFVLATGVLFYLLLATANLVGILKNLNRILEKNRKNIDDTLEKLPEITDNVAAVSDILKDEMESIQKVVNNVGKISESAKDAAELLRKDVLVKAKGILDIIDWIKKLFEKDQKKKEIVYKYRYKPGEETVVAEVPGDPEKEDPKGSGCGEDDAVSDSGQKEGEKNLQDENQQGAGV
ncbi:MAG: hypothetical protein GXZ01_02480 [Clostridiaceae bacterium]|jgi:F0F1-type ATP synthase membrane subunit b/b'|nr:hypothetical protein [Clostridiaceae bacterium]